MADINPGDTVRVKSGGPLMTVSSVFDEYGETTALCLWFDGRPQQDKFPVTVLVHAELAKPGTASFRVVRG